MTHDTINDALMDPIVQDALFNVEKRERAYQAEVGWNRLEVKEEGKEIGLIKGKELEAQIRSQSGPPPQNYDLFKLKRVPGA